MNSTVLHTFSPLKESTLQKLQNHSLPIVTDGLLESTSINTSIFDDALFSKNQESKNISLESQKKQPLIKITPKIPITKKVPKSKTPNLAANGNSKGKEWLRKNKAKGLIPPAYLDYTTEYIDAKVTRFEDNNIDETMYLTKYKRYKKKTWQPRSNLFNSPKHIEEFEDWLSKNNKKQNF